MKSSYYVWSTVVLAFELVGVTVVDFSLVIWTVGCSAVLLGVLLYMKCYVACCLMHVVTLVVLTFNSRTLVSQISICFLAYYL